MLVCIEYAASVFYYQQFRRPMSFQLRYFSKPFASFLSGIKFPDILQLSLTLPHVLQGIKYPYSTPKSSPKNQLVPVRYLSRPQASEGTAFCLHINHSHLASRFPQPLLLHRLVAARFCARGLGAPLTDQKAWNQHSREPTYSLPSPQTDLSPSQTIWPTSFP